MHAGGDIMLAANPARWNITRALFAPETMRRVRHATVGPKRRRRGLGPSVPSSCRRSSRRRRRRRRRRRSLSSQRQDTKGISHKLAYDLSPAKRLFSLSLSLQPLLSTRYYASSQQKENNGSGHLGALFKTIRACAYL